MTTPFEEGDPTSAICVLAEAPARTEIKLQRPLVGSSGLLFNEMLHEAKIARQSLYILNVWEEEVWKSKDDKVIFDQDGNKLFIAGRGLTPLGLDKAAPTIRRLRESKARVIVPLGSVALALCYGDTRITKWRGSILAAKEPKGRKLVATFHPAFILRGNHIHRYTVKHDLARALEESRYGSIRLPERNLYINPVFPDVVAFLKQANKAPIVATDIECLNWHVSCFSVATSASESMCIPLLDERQQHRWTDEQELEIWSLYAKLLANEKIKKVNQNLLFDISFLLSQNNLFTSGALGCTMIAHHILYPDFPKGLDFLCSTYTREPYYKDDGKLWSKPWVDMERFWIYNAKDSACAFEIMDGLEPELDREGHRQTYERTLAMFRPLMYMMVHGIRVNVARLAEQKEEAKALLQERENDLRAIAEWDFNPGSPKQCQEYFYGTKGLKPYTSLKTGGITTDDKAMARIAKRYNLPEARLVQEIRGLRKLISNYLEVRYDTDERIRCSYNPRGTTTGRLSSSETVFGTGLNFTNLDSRFKDFLEADPL